MDWELALKIGQGALVVVQAIVVGVMWAAAKHFATKDELAKAKARGDTAHHRLDLLEQRVASLPNDDDIRSLTTAVANLASDMRENSVRVETAVLGVKRIEDYLIGARS